MKRITLPALAALMTASGAHAYTIEARLTAPPAAVEVAQTVPEQQVVRAGAPLTVALDGERGNVLRTRFSGLSSSADAPLVRVFVNATDADEETPLTDPGFVGTIAFYPLPLGGVFTSTLNVGRVTERAETVTYVLTGSSDNALTIADAELIAL